jgi:NADH:ubiquinone oxidoreductase, NADH-binding (51 kD) subunit
MCTYEPIVEVVEPGKKRVTYVNVTPEKATEIMYKHIFGGDPVVKYTINGEFKTLSEQNFYAKQKRVVLKNCGEINPEDIQEYISKDGYQGLAKAVLEMTPEEVIEVMKDYRTSRQRRWSDSLQALSGVLRRQTRPTRSTSSATQTKVTRAHSWTVPFLKATLTQYSRLWP